MKKIAIIGTSGFAREVADIALDCNYTKIVFLSKEKESIVLDDFEVLEEREDVVNNLHAQDYHFAIAIADPEIKKKVYQRLSHLTYPNLIHSSVSFGYKQKEKVLSKQGNIIAAGCRFTNNIDIGNFGIYNLNTVIGHDCNIFDYVSLMSLVVISGNVEIRDQVYIGSNAIIRQGKENKKLIIEENTFIGMGAVVLSRVKKNTKVFGSPAKVGFLNYFK